MYFYLSPHISYPSAYLKKFQTNGVKLRFGQDRVLKVFLAESVHQDVSDAVQEQTELVGRKT